jgi:hypothetical protein
MVRLVVWTELELVGRVDTGRFKGLLKVHLCAYTDTRYAYALQVVESFGVLICICVVDG